MDDSKTEAKQMKQQRIGPLMFWMYHFDTFRTLTAQLSINHGNVYPASNNTGILSTKVFKLELS